MLPVGKQKPFAERMGFANESHPSNEGIVADWSVLPVETKAVRRGWTFVGSGISPATELGGGGHAEWNYAWKADNDRTLNVHIVVFNKGQPAAIEKMDRVGNSSNMPVNPFGPAPDKMKLGDWTAVPYPEQANKRGRTHSVFWVYRNVFAHVRMTDGEGVNALPIARAIQTFTEKYQVDDLPAHLPKISDLRIAPERVSVGETFRAEVIGALNANWQISVQDIEGEVECEARDGPTSTWEAVEAGLTLDPRSCGRAESIAIARPDALGRHTGVEPAVARTFRSGGGKKRGRPASRQAIVAGETPWLFSMNASRSNSMQRDQLSGWRSLEGA